MSLAIEQRPNSKSQMNSLTLVDLTGEEEEEEEGRGGRQEHEIIYLPDEIIDIPDESDGSDQEEEEEEFSESLPTTNPLENSLPKLRRPHKKPERLTLDFRSDSRFREGDDEVVPYNQRNLSRKRTRERDRQRERLRRRHEELLGGRETDLEKSFPPLPSFPSSSSSRLALIEELSCPPPLEETLATHHNLLQTSRLYPLQVSLHGPLHPSPYPATSSEEFYALPRLLQQCDGRPVALLHQTNRQLPRLSPLAEDFLLVEVGDQQPVLPPVQGEDEANHPAGWGEEEGGEGHLNGQPSPG